MARPRGKSRARRSGAGLRRPPAEDRISALPDDIILLILRRLDTRSALGTGSLSRRWAHLPRELGYLDFRVGDLLPPRYHQWVHLYNDIRGKLTVLDDPRVLTLELLPHIRRYERRAMRAFARSAESFQPRPRRMVKRLSLEFLVTGNAAGCVNRLIAEAIDAWGVEDLEAVAKPVFRRRRETRRGEEDIHTFPSHGLCKEPRASRLRSLKLAGCMLPGPLHEYSHLTVLILQGIPESTPAAAYEDIFTLCPQLRTLHLISCGCRTGKGVPLTVAVDAPSSQIRELVVEDCTFLQLLLVSLPCLESLASLESRVVFLESFPCLSRRNISMRLNDWHLKLKLDMFLLEFTPGIRNLIIRFTGAYRWIVPPSAFLPNLRRLLVADVPSSWDVTWPRLLLEMAPHLESLHIHIVAVDKEPGEEIPWSPTELRQHHLKEFVVVGFEGTARQMCLVKFVVGVSTALCRFSMFKNGHVGYKGHWDWEMPVTPQEESWSDEEKAHTVKHIMDGVSSSAAPLQLVLG